MAEAAVVAARGRKRRAWHQRFGHSLRHSLRLRLIVLFLLFALAMSVAFIGGMQRAFTSGWREAARPLVSDYVDRLAAEIGSPPDVARAQALTRRLPLSVRIDGPLVNWQSSPAEAAERLDRHWRRNAGPHDRDLAALLSRQTADGHRIRFGLGELSWQSRPQRLIWVTLGVLLLLTAIAYLAIRRLLRPLNDIRAGAERFGAGDFSRPIPVRKRDELGDLADRINTSAAQLHRMLEAKRGLLLAISHELRSPLTRARLNAELLAPTPDNQRLGAALLRDLAEMRDLIEALLEGERLASPHAALQRAPTDVAALAQGVIDELAEDAATRSVAAEPAGAAAVQAIVLIAPPDLPMALLDAARIRVLLRNLARNALQHGAGADRSPQITLAADAETLSLTVRDFGPGVEETQLPHLAEPFFRADRARQRATGGVGLGLYLCRLIALAHGGTIDPRNAAPGLKWTVRLPVRDGFPEQGRR